MLPSSNPALIPPRPLRRFGGAGLAIAIAALVALVLVTIFFAATGEPGQGSRVDIPYLLGMTVTQALLSMALSLIVGLALAWTLNRLRFPGRDLLVGLFASAIVTPGLVVAFGLLAVWGRNGWVNSILQSTFGFSIGNHLFGLTGILAAHVILDGAFAARILLARMDALPDTRLKTGQSLGLSAWQRFAIIDWPAVRGTLPGLGAIIFLLAFTSFPIVLMLGGGPANQTLEVAIYSAVRLDFDLRGAVTLALVQIVVCSGIILLSSGFSPVPAALGPSTGQHWADRPVARIIQWVVLTLGTIGFAAPLAATLAGGFGPDFWEVTARASFWRSLASSLVIATLSSLLTLGLALVLAMGRSAMSHPLARLAVGAPAYAYLAVPAVVLSLGFFLLVRNTGIGPDNAAPFVVIIANALLALPFAMAALGPPLDAVARGQGRLIRSLGLSGWQQFRLVEFPLLSKDIGVVLALAFCFSLGDLGVIALFGTSDFATLPLLMMRALGAYRNDDAGVIAALMLILTIVAFIALPRLFGKLANAHA